MIAMRVLARMGVEIPSSVTCIELLSVANDRTLP